MVSAGLDHLDHEDVEFLLDVRRLVGNAVALAGSVPAAGSPAWMTATPATQVAGLLVLAEAYLINDPHTIAAQMVKDASVAVSSSGRWSTAAALPSHHELRQRRAEPGPLAGMVFDPVAAARWVATGSSAEIAA